MIGAVYSATKLGYNFLWYTANPDKIPDLITYEIPKMAFESTASAASWGTRKICNLGESIADWVVPPKETTPFVPGFEDSSKMQGFYDRLARETNKLSIEATSWATGKSVTRVKMEETINPWAFKAKDLIGPAFFLGFCTNQALTNLSSATHHFRLLVTNTKFVSIAYQTPALNSNTMAIVEKTRRYTIPKLFKDTAMESILTALWSTGAYFSYRGIYNAVLDASGSAPQAAYIANTILAAGLAAPLLYSMLEEAVFSSPDAQHKPSKIAPHLEYTDADERRFVDIESEKLTPQQKLEYLEKLRPTPASAAVPDKQKLKYLEKGSSAAAA